MGLKAILIGGVSFLALAMIGTVAMISVEQSKLMEESSTLAAKEVAGSLKKLEDCERWAARQSKAENQLGNQEWRETPASWMPSCLSKMGQ